MKTTLLPVVLCLAASAQEPGRPAFDAASVKPAQPAPVAVGSVHGGPGTSDPDRIRAAKMSLANLLTRAYDVNEYQIAGLDWMFPEPRDPGGRFDVEAVVPANTTREQLRLMWQSLLADRFGVVLHRESRQMNVEQLVVAKGGPKFQPSAMDPALPAVEQQDLTREQAAKIGDDGCAQLTVAAIATTMKNLHAQGTYVCLVGSRQTMTQLAAFLSSRLRTPVVDRTGLAGTYDFAAPFGPRSAYRQLRDTLDPELGLTLVYGKARVEVLVVDKVNRTPTAN